MPDGPVDDDIQLLPLPTGLPEDPATPTLSGPHAAPPDPGRHRAPEPETRTATAISGGQVGEEFSGLPVGEFSELSVASQIQARGTGNAAHSARSVFENTGPPIAILRST